MNGRPSISPGSPIACKELSAPELGRSEESHQTHIGLYEDVLDNWDREQNRVGLLLPELGQPFEVTAPIGPIEAEDGTPRSPKLRKGGEGRMGWADDGTERPLALVAIRERTPKLGAFMLFAELDDGRVLFALIPKNGSRAARLSAEFGEIPEEVLGPSSPTYDRIREIVGGWLRSAPTAAPAGTGLEEDTEASERGEEDTGSGTGAGYERDPERKKAVEQRAMDLAEDHYRSKGFTVDDVSADSPYDVHCERGTVELHVEVKGTTQDGRSVTLTGNEVEHARLSQDTGVDYESHLFVVSNVDVGHAEDQGEPVAEGGTAHILENWLPEDDDLKATEYRYAVPTDRWTKVT